MHLLMALWLVMPSVLAACELIICYAAPCRHNIKLVLALGNTWAAYRSPQDFMRMAGLDPSEKTRPALSTKRPSSPGTHTSLYFDAQKLRLPPPRPSTLALVSSFNDAVAFSSAFDRVAPLHVCGFAALLHALMHEHTSCAQSAYLHVSVPYTACSQDGLTRLLHAATDAVLLPRPHQGHCVTCQHIQQDVSTGPPHVACKPSCGSYKW